MKNMPVRIMMITGDRNVRIIINDFLFILNPATAAGFRMYGKKYPHWYF